MTYDNLKTEAAKFDVRVEAYNVTPGGEDYPYSVHGFLANIDAFLRTLPVEFRQNSEQGVWFSLAATPAE